LRYRPAILLFGLLVCVAAFGCSDTGDQYLVGCTEHTHYTECRLDRDELKVRAADGDADAQVVLAVTDRRWDDRRLAHPESISLLRKSADQGNKWGQAYLGLALYYQSARKDNGDPATVRISMQREANRYLSLAADQQVAIANLGLSLSYLGALGAADGDPALKAEARGKVAPNIWKAWVNDEPLGLVLLLAAELKSIIKPPSTARETIDRIWGGKTRSLFRWKRLANFGRTGAKHGIGAAAYMAGAALMSIDDTARASPEVLKWFHIAQIMGVRQAADTISVYVEELKQDADVSRRAEQAAWDWLKSIEESEKGRFHEAAPWCRRIHSADRACPYRMAFRHHYCVLPRGLIISGFVLTREYHQCMTKYYDGDGRLASVLAEFTPDAQILALIE